eukprot:15366718-Ditylum_brightwellii.AAC.1
MTNVKLLNQLPRKISSKMGLPHLQGFQLRQDNDKPLYSEGHQPLITCATIIYEHMLVLM